MNSLLVKDQGKASQTQSRNSNSSTEYSSLFSLMENMSKGKEEKTPPPPPPLARSHWGKILPIILKHLQVTLFKK
jgi:hypothetical protein